MKIRLIAAAAATMLCANVGRAQVSETVNFDNYVSPTNNDYHNRFNEFWGPTGLIQITDSGITGGCLRVPNNSLTVSNAERYCSKYKNQLGAIFTTTFSFLWDSSSINTLAGIQNITELYLHASTAATANSNVWVHLRNDKTLHVLNWDGGSSGGTDTATGANTLVQFHWYKITAITNSIGGSFGDELQITAELHDLGTSGTASPILVSSLTTTKSNVPFINDTAIYINVIGAKWAGCTYIDNFTFNGYKSADSCLPANTSVQTFPNKGEAISDPIPNPSGGITTVAFTLPTGTEQGKIAIYSTTGQLIKAYPVNGSVDYVTIDNSTIPAGVYYYTLIAAGKTTNTKKMVVMH